MTETGDFWTWDLLDVVGVVFRIESELPTILLALRIDSSNYLDVCSLGWDLVSQIPFVAWLNLVSSR